MKVTQKKKARSPPVKRRPSPEIEYAPLAMVKTLTRAVKMVTESTLAEVERLTRAFKVMRMQNEIIMWLIERVAPEELLTRKRAAKLLGVGEKTLKRWADAGLVPVVRRKGRGAKDIVRYRLADLLKVAAHRPGTSRWASKTGGRR